MIEVGATVGNYQVLQKIGAGAMGNVFLAHHPVIGRRVALKVIHPELASNEEMIARFFNEARAVTQIGHQNIVDVQDFGQTPDGDSFIIMELLEGASLGDTLKQEGPLAVPRAVHIAIQLADGLAAAHARGIIHRDLKPDNIFLINRNGDPDFVKLLDFGLAKLTGPAQAVQHQTKTGSLLGTPHYMAPEQAENVKTIDQRADVYSLGCILFQTLTGRVPFPGEGFGEVLVRHVREPPPLPSRLNPRVSPALEKIVLHALAKKPEFRFGSMDEFRQALRDPDGFAQTLDGRGGLRLTPDSMPVARPQPVGRGHFAVGAPPPAGPPPPNASAPVRVSHEAKTMMAQPAPDLATVQRAAAAAAATRNEPKPEHPLARAQPRPVAAATVVKPPRRSRAGLFAGIGLLLVGAGGGAGYFTWARSRPIAVTIVTTPAGAEAFDGERTLGRTPLSTSLPRGSEPHRLTFKKDGYLTAQRSVTPQANVTLDVKLLPQPAPDADDAAPLAATPPTTATTTTPPPAAAATTPVVAASTPAAAATTPVAATPKPTPPVAPPPAHAAAPAHVATVAKPKPATASHASMADKGKKLHGAQLKPEDTLILTPSF